MSDTHSCGCCECCAAWRELHERDMEAGGADLYRRVQQAERERDEARALLRDAERWLPSDVTARLDALLGREGRDE